MPNIYLTSGGTREILVRKGPVTGLQNLAAELLIQAQERLGTYNNKTL
jgi:hypothetical protein